MYHNLFVLNILRISNERLLAGESQCDIWYIAIVHPNLCALLVRSASDFEKWSGPSLCFQNRIPSKKRTYAQNTVLRQSTLESTIQ